MNHLMRYFLIAVFLILPTSAIADKWDKYVLSMDRFYNLDKQNFESISCDIEVPLTKNQVKQLHDQFDQMKDKVELEENLTAFRMTYTKKTGLTFNQPALNIKIISENGMSDPAKVKKGIEMVETGFKHQIDGTIMQLQGLFDGLDTLKKSEYKIKEIKDDGRSYTAEYEKGGNNITEAFLHNQRNVIQISKNGDKISSTEYYKSINGNNKLLLTGVQADINNAMGNIEMSVTISYEKLKGIFFPTHTSNHIKQVIQTLKQEGQFDIYLRNCTVR
jgi:hypothetical protein